MSAPIPLVPASEFIKLALAQAGKPYIWAKKGPNEFDCSGLVTWCIKQLGGPDLTQSWNAARLYAESLHANADGAIEPGHLVFYGAPHSPPNHVMVAISPVPGTQDWRVFGACGGGHLTLTPTKGACVQYRSGLRYRPDCIKIGPSIRIDYSK